MKKGRKAVYSIPGGRRGSWRYTGKNAHEKAVQKAKDLGMKKSRIRRSYE